MALPLESLLHSAIHAEGISDSLQALLDIENILRSENFDPNTALQIIKELEKLIQTPSYKILITLCNIYLQLPYQALSTD